MGYMLFNGELVKRSQGKIDIEDRGYQFGDGIYEVIALYGGRPFALGEHLDRLYESAGKIHMHIPYTKKELAEGIERLLEKEKRENGYVYMQFSRGVSVRDHMIPKKITGTLVAYLLDGKPKETLKQKGMRAALTEDIRWLRCDIKTTSLLGNVLVKQKATEAGAMEAILYRDKTVTEGSSSNVWIVKDGIIQTHPANHLILNGITRQRILSLCQKHGLPYYEKPFTVDDLLQADEVFLTSTSLEIAPVVEIGDHRINDGKPGPVTKTLQTLFDEDIHSHCFAGKEQFI